MGNAIRWLDVCWLTIEKTLTSQGAVLITTSGRLRKLLLNDITIIIIVVVVVVKTINLTIS